MRPHYRASSIASINWHRRDYSSPRAAVCPFSNFTQLLIACLPFSVSLTSSPVWDMTLQAFDGTYSPFAINTRPIAWIRGYYLSAAAPFFLAKSWRSRSSLAARLTHGKWAISTRHLSLPSPGVGKHQFAFCPLAGSPVNSAVICSMQCGNQFHRSAD